MTPSGANVLQTSRALLGASGIGAPEQSQQRFEQNLRTCRAPEVHSARQWQWQGASRRLVKFSMNFEAISDKEHNEQRALLVEDHVVFRECLGVLIHRELGMSICGEADNIQDAMKLILKTQPDIAIVDLTLRGSNGLELIKDCRARGLDLKILVLSMHDEDLYAERVLRAGARGYISKTEPSAEVIKAIRRVLKGEAYVSGRVTSRLLDRISGKPREVKGIESLTDRELEVFNMLGRGKKIREIAQLLHLGETTVDTYRTRIREKLGLRSSTELFLRAGDWVREHGG